MSLKRKEELFMIKGIIWDVDDTLYNQLLPFQTALKQTFPEIYPHLPMDAFYKQFRHNSDAVFFKQVSGEWSLEYMRQYRIQQTLLDFNYPKISLETAQVFQEHYQYELDHIELMPVIRNLLDSLAKTSLQLGVITNGPSDHQHKKIKQLTLSKWIPTSQIIVSGDVQTEKPGAAIFKQMEMRTGLKEEELLYIGDSFANDVVGANQANWSVLWFNHRHHSPLDPELSYTEIQSADELASYLHQHHLN